MKCDGKVPCTRCQHENNVCCYGERKKSVERRIPPGYVEYLEGQQEVLVRALKKAWSEYVRPSPYAQNIEDPPVHSILEQLGVSVDVYRPHRFGAEFEEDLEKVRSEMVANAAIQAPSISSRGSSPDMLPDITPGLSSGTSSATPSATSDLTFSDPFDRSVQQDYVTSNWFASPQSKLDTVPNNMSGYEFNDPMFVFNPVTSSQSSPCFWPSAMDGQVQSPMQIETDFSGNWSSRSRHGFIAELNSREEDMFDGYINESPE